MKIASLEDDLAQAQLIQHVLAEAGHTCSSFATGQELLNVLQKSQPFDLLLLDWEIPDITGLEIVRWVRVHVGYDLPIMFLTSRTLESDLVIGLQAGADDYMVKPIRAGELVARIDALSRRHSLPQSSKQIFNVEAYVIDPVAGKISLQGQEVVLAPKEFELAVLFFRNPARLFSRDVLSALIWNREVPATSRTLDTHLSSIRQKLQLRPEHGVRLTSSYALGYRLDLVSNSTTP
ncbi:MAG TPA: response regulator transcription factor [Eoetvoesiella sp.]